MFIDVINRTKHCLRSISRLFNQSFKSVNNVLVRIFQNIKRFFTKSTPGKRQKVIVINYSCEPLSKYIVARKLRETPAKWLGTAYVSCELLLFELNYKDCLLTNKFKKRLLKHASKIVIIFSMDNLKQVDQHLNSLCQLFGKQHLMLCCVSECDYYAAPVYGEHERGFIFDDDNRQLFVDGILGNNRISLITDDSKNTRLQFTSKALSDVCALNYFLRSIGELTLKQCVFIPRYSVTFDDSDNKKIRYGLTRAVSRLRCEPKFRKFLRKHTEKTFVVTFLVISFALVFSYGSKMVKYNDILNASNKLHVEHNSTIENISLLLALYHKTNSNLVITDKKLKSAVDKVIFENISKSFFPHVIPHLERALTSFLNGNLGTMPTYQALFVYLALYRPKHINISLHKNWFLNIWKNSLANDGRMFDLYEQQLNWQQVQPMLNTYLEKISNIKGPSLYQPDWHLISQVQQKLRQAKLKKQLIDASIHDVIYEKGSTVLYSSETTFIHTDNERLPKLFLSPLWQQDRGGLLKKINKQLSQINMVLSVSHDGIVQLNDDGKFTSVNLGTLYSNAWAKFINGTRVVTPHFIIDNQKMITEFENSIEPMFAILIKNHVILKIDLQAYKQALQNLSSSSEQLTLSSKPDLALKNYLKSNLQTGAHESTTISVVKAIDAMLENESDPIIKNALHSLLLKPVQAQWQSLLNAYAQTLQQQWQQLQINYSQNIAPFFPFENAITDVNPVIADSFFNPKYGTLNKFIKDNVLFLLKQKDGVWGNGYWLNVSTGFSPQFLDFINWSDSYDKTFYKDNTFNFKFTIYPIPNQSITEWRFNYGNQDWQYVNGPQTWHSFSVTEKKQQDDIDISVSYLNKNGYDEIEGPWAFLKLYKYRQLQSDSTYNILLKSDKGKPRELFKLKFIPGKDPIKLFKRSHNFPNITYS